MQLSSQINHHHLNYNYRSKYQHFLEIPEFDSYFC